MANVENRKERQIDNLIPVRVLQVHWWALKLEIFPISQLHSLSGTC